jgi:hypothetical protein
MIRPVDLAAASIALWRSEIEQTGETGSWRVHIRACTSGILRRRSHTMWISSDSRSRSSGVRQDGLHLYDPFENHLVVTRPT